MVLARIGQYTRRDILACGAGVLALSSGRPLPARRQQSAKEIGMGQVSSSDGTTIGYSQAGSGPPLVLVHGATADRTRWARVAPRLERASTVHAMDRRGRGLSADAAEYSIEREFEDVAAVVDAVAEAAGVAVDLLGHSFGGICAMEGARHTRNLRRLVLYEPAGVSLDSPMPAGLLERLETLAAADRREELLVTFFSEAVRMPPSELAMFRTLPAWQGRVAAAHTLPRELRAIETYRYDRTRIATIDVPALVLTGGDSPSDVRAICDFMVDALPQGRLHVLPGQQHIAMDTAPDLFVEAVQAFLTSD